MPGVPSTPGRATCGTRWCARRSAAPTRSPGVRWSHRATSPARSAGPEAGAPPTNPGSGPDRGASRGRSPRRRPGSARPRARRRGSDVGLKISPRTGVVGARGRVRGLCGRPARHPGRPHGPRSSAGLVSFALTLLLPSNSTELDGLVRCLHRDRPHGSPGRCRGAGRWWLAVGGGVRSAPSTPPLRRCVPASTPGARRSAPAPGPPRPIRCPPGPGGGFGQVWRGLVRTPLTKPRAVDLRERACVSSVSSVRPPQGGTWCRERRPARTRPQLPETRRRPVGVASGWCACRCARAAPIPSTATGQGGDDGDHGPWGRGHPGGGHQVVGDLPTRTQHQGGDRGGLREPAGGTCRGGDPHA